MLFGCANDEQFESELGIGDCEIIDDELVYRDSDSKCYNCNCALRDCSLCGSDVEG